MGINLRRFYGYGGVKKQMPVILRCAKKEIPVFLRCATKTGRTKKGKALRKTGRTHTEKQTYSDETSAPDPLVPVWAQGLCGGAS